MKHGRIIPLALGLLLAVSLAGIAAAQHHAGHGSASQRTAALEHGTQILAGVTLEASTPIADLLAEPEAFEGKVVQIEGQVVALCSMMGCWATLLDADGNQLNVKVEDGVIDLREMAAEEHYMVAEGVFQAAGEHGSQVFIMEHGAVALAAE